MCRYERHGRSGRRTKRGAGGRRPTPPDPVLIGSVAGADLFRVSADHFILAIETTISSDPFDRQDWTDAILRFIPSNWECWTEWVGIFELQHFTPPGAAG